MLISGRICKAADYTQSGFGEQNILLVLDMPIAQKNAKLLIILKQLSVQFPGLPITVCL
jgi:hypothetical protein